jgi:hypothetical protein
MSQPRRALPVGHILFVNGLASDRLSTTEQSVFGAPPAGERYWSRDFVEGAAAYFGVDAAAVTFTNEPFGAIATGGQYLNASARRTLGAGNFKKYWGSRNFGLSNTRTQAIAVVTHSMGAAYSHGLMDEIKSGGINIAMIVHINPFQPASGAYSGTDFGFTAHVQTENDPVVRNIPRWVTFLGSFLPGIRDIARIIDEWRRIQQPGWLPGAKPILRPGPSDLRFAHYHPIGQGRGFWFPSGQRAAFGHQQFDHAP